MAEIKPTKTHLNHLIKIKRMAFQALFLKRMTWLHLGGSYPIQRPQLNRNDSH